jgi:serine/threonine-protein kinase
MTEYIPGQSLRARMAQSKLSTDDAVAVMRQVLGGLGHAHRAGIVHRDMKPENILVHERAGAEGLAADGVVKITDFGLGKAANDIAVTSIAYSASLNNPEARDIAGTLDYMAPEQRSGGPVDARADLYACGVVLYELLTGERPAGTDVPSDVNPAVPRHLDEAFRRSYARLEKRFASAEEFLIALGTKAAAQPPALPRMVGESMSACPQCRLGVGPDDQFCMHCGVQLVADVRRCARCGGYPESTDEYCIFCGDALSPRRLTAV